MNLLQPLKAVGTDGNLYWLVVNTSTQQLKNCIWHDSICCSLKDRQSSNPVTANIRMATISVTHNTCLHAQQALSFKPERQVGNQMTIAFQLFVVGFFFFLFKDWITWKTGNLSTARGQHGPTIKQVSCSSAEVPLPQPAATLANCRPCSYCPLHCIPKIQQPEQVAATAWPSLDQELQFLKVKTLGH